MAEPNQTSPPTTATGGRRRSSGFMPGFESLKTQKNSADVIRRQSLSDQAVKGGYLSQAFHKYDWQALHCTLSR
ncbi:hypothetical protein AAL_04824 [Moelleriella libera RCEF 2490]|uniref:Uncharacterized protein n=1 Tax=Moelleriella libera RCEF 2490 TaxID=1081109 RepID=A0A162IKB8_9HYPO|nr:hypothetical protein AAL_04824 [Moelleriella libera RCEF 2490]